jgi:hypothetical protein
MNNWYEDCIEEPIRDVVKLLRDNGFNTESSCGHEMYVQCKYYPDGEIQRLYVIISEYLKEMKISRDFEIIVKLKVRGMDTKGKLDIIFK